MATLVLTAAMAGVILAVAGGGEPAARLLTRLTARLSALLVLAVFLAYSRLDLPAWLQANRAALLLALTASHTGHLAAIVWLDAVSPERPLRQAGAVAIVGGGLAYAMLAALALAALRDRSLGRWGSFSMYYIYLIFLTSYAGRVLQLHDWWFAPLAAALAAGLVLRAYGAVRHVVEWKR